MSRYTERALVLSQTADRLMIRSIQLSRQSDAIRERAHEVRNRLRDMYRAKPRKPKAA